MSSTLATRLRPWAADSRGYRLIPPTPGAGEVGDRGPRGGGRRGGTLAGSWGRGMGWNGFWAPWGKQQRGTHTPLTPFGVGVYIYIYVYAHTI